MVWGFELQLNNHMYNVFVMSKKKVFKSALSAISQNMKRGTDIADLAPCLITEYKLELKLLVSIS